MNFETLFHANFSLLDDAVTDWATLVRNLGELKKDAETNLHQAADKANWAGMNQQVSKEFIGKTAGEFADAHTQASTIHQVLSDTLGELRGYHRQLTTAVENGRKRSLSVFPSGDAFMVTSSVPPQTAAAGEPDRTADVTALRDEIQGILDKATESDNSAGTVLKALADQSELGFSDARYKDRDSAAAALKKADELARLAKKDPGELTTAEFDLLNAGLKQYANDHLFAERFATDLGARGTLDLWTGLNDVPGAGDVGQRRHDRYDDLQKSLGLTLATASQSDSAGMAEWKGRMVDLADKPVGRAGGFPLGAQVMTNLMRWGDYDDRFLVDYGDKLIETEKKFTGNGRHGAWSRTGGDPLLNRTGTDSGWDPMTGYLRALSNNPDAATEFFNDTFVTKDEDHDFTQDADGNGNRRSGHSATSTISSKSGTGPRTWTTRARRASRGATTWAWPWRPRRRDIRRANCARWTLPRITTGRQNCSKRSSPPFRTTALASRITRTCRTAWAKSRPSTSLISIVRQLTSIHILAVTTRAADRLGTGSKNCIQWRAPRPN
ncbi:DUF6571 family protein [Streptomyces longwoodensis]|uniref:DUF6571 family protein n=1 Tax=Streptomyces longwoodensis TaxID=68231 RepID=UPI0033F21ACC